MRENVVGTQNISGSYNAIIQGSGNATVNIALPDVRKQCLDSLFLSWSQCLIRHFLVGNPLQTPFIVPSFKHAAYLLYWREWSDGTRIAMLGPRRWRLHSHILWHYGVLSMILYLHWVLMPLVGMPIRILGVCSVRHLPFFFLVLTFLSLCLSQDLQATSLSLKQEWPPPAFIAALQDCSKSTDVNYYRHHGLSYCAVYHLPALPLVVELLLVT